LPSLFVLLVTRRNSRRPRKLTQAMGAVESFGVRPAPNPHPIGTDAAASE